MKVLIKFIVGALVILSTCGCCKNGSNPKPVKPAVESSVQATTPDVVEFMKDFGKVHAGDILRHTFSWQNTASKPVTITQVSTSCSCTKADVKKRDLAPGESTDVYVEVNTQGYSTAIKQMAFVSTDDLDNPVMRFIIKAEVIK